LKTQHTTATEFSQACQRILKAVYFTERIELIDDKPQTLIAFLAIHGLDDAKTHPGRDETAERRNFTGLVG
jgi:hypothetical protein